MKPKVYFLFGLAVGLLLVALVGIGLFRPYTYQGTVYDPPLAAAGGSLIDQSGRPFVLSDFSNEGKVKAALVFFGYTHCPDVCPVTMAEFKQVKDRLGEQAEQVRFVFVTVDPERDTPEHLQTYLSNFDAALIGLTGTEAEMQPVWDHFGIYRAKQESGSAVGYLMDHSARTYLLDGQGNVHLTYSYGTEVDKIVSDIRHFLKVQ